MVMNYLRPTAALLILFTILTGLIYPLAMTGIAQLAFPWRANGSLVVRGAQVAGSELIGQRFATDRYFHGRPSAAGEAGYDAGASSGSNLGPTSKKLIDRVTTDAAALRQTGAAVVPADAVTTSASGLDPDISPAFAELQVNKVATARGVPATRIRDIVAKSVKWTRFGFLGEARVNVFLLNLALDAELPAVAG